MCLFAAELKKARDEGKKCHAKSIMSRKADELSNKELFIFRRIKKGESLGEKMSHETMMTRKTDKELQQTPNMCHLGRTRRKKDEGRS